MAEEARCTGDAMSPKTKTAARRKAKTGARATPVKVARNKVIVTNARTRGKLAIDRVKYEPMAKALRGALKAGGGLGYTELLKAVAARLKNYPGSPGWYLMTVLRDLESRGQVVCRRKEGRPLYALKHGK
jgi:hypothetical protein